MPWTPTYEFPNPLARVPPAGYWVCPLAAPWRYGMTDSVPATIGRNAYYIRHRPQCHIYMADFWLTAIFCHPILITLSLIIYLVTINSFSLLEDPKRTTDVIMEALKDTEQRGIIDRGWGNLRNPAEVADNVFLLEECPHDWLFPQCSAVVHHGGAGTTATGLKAGCPTTIVPFFGDQFFWGDRICQKGLGLAPIPVSQLSLQHLSNAIKFLLQPEVKSRAMEIAKLIENEDGVTAAVDAFHRHLHPELPLPTLSPVEEIYPNHLQWFFSNLQTFAVCFVVVYRFLAFIKFSFIHYTNYNL